MRKLCSFLLLTLLLSCNSARLPHKTATLTTAQGHKVITYLALTLSEQEQGLSGIKENEFKDNEGMLFYYQEAGEKHFWMPDTYFNLDLIYLDGNFKVLDIVRNLAHYKGRSNPNLIPRARGVWSYHVLEMKAASSIAQQIQVGDQLKFEFSKEAKEVMNSL